MKLLSLIWADKIRDSQRVTHATRSTYLELSPPRWVLSFFKMYFVCGCFIVASPVQSLAIWSVEPHLKQPPPAVINYCNKITWGKEQQFTTKHWHSAQCCKNETSTKQNLTDCDIGKNLGRTT